MLAEPSETCVFRALSTYDRWLISERENISRIGRLMRRPEVGVGGVIITIANLTVVDGAGETNGYVLWCFYRARPNLANHLSLRS